MPNIKGTTRAQTNFLRGFRNEQFGPGADLWPSAAVLRRWLRRPRFLAAMKSLRGAMRYQADFQLLSAAASAAQVLHTTIAAGELEPQVAQLKALGDLLKLAHLRERFAAADPKATPRDGEVMSFLRRLHPTITLKEALDALDEDWDDDGPITEYDEDVA